jgi:hypothetical protein
MEQPVHQVVAHVRTGAQRHLRGDADRPDRLGDLGHRESGEVRGRSVLDHFEFARLGTGVVGDAGIREVDGDALRGDRGAAVGEPHREHDVGGVSLDGGIQSFPCRAELDRQQLGRDGGVAVPVGRKLPHRVPRAVAGGVVERFEAGEQNGGHPTRLIIRRIHLTSPIANGAARRRCPVAGYRHDVSR